MNQVRHQAQERGHWADAHTIAGLLRRSGPLDLRHLLEEPVLEEWSLARVEEAVTAAWAQSLVSIDAGDRFVAL